MDLIITCKFRVFAQAYTGTFDSEKIFELAKDGIFFVQQNIKNVQKNLEPITDEDLMAVWDEWVEIRFTKLPERELWEANLDVICTGNPTREEFNLTCDCLSPILLSHKIIKLVADER